MNRWTQSGFALMALGFAATPVVAQDNPRPKALTITAEYVRAAAEGHQDRDALYPGDTVRYELVFTNVVDVPVRNIEFTDRIPTGLIYVPASSTSDAADVDIEYSIDGGSTYHETPMVTRTVDGRQIEEPAPVHRYTHIRWRVLDLIQPGAQVTAAFRATLPSHTEPKSPSSSRTGRDG